ncbi:PKD domain-containing protein [Kibdelosporangium philippinense]|uniref:PKD domain-containing protein n=1 Tax=Kibdelosporangium philippinense TaxID=211113 RepID=A0ABS8ZGN8_9PSEU|nr:PKD domain-containing protein [Kibdelosporangium philippinense]MCE7005673.1 PKD domain-containing protein [Kibdelosporangium philippinense]
MKTIALVGAVLAVVTTIVLLGQGNPTEKVRVLPGAAWLPSSKVGQATLLDGTTAEVVAQVPVAAGGNVLELTQQGTTGYAVDKTSGVIRRIDGATFELTPPSALLPNVTSGLTAFAGPDTLYAVDTQHGIVMPADPRTVLPIGDAQPLSAQLDANTAVVDDRGQLWIIDNATGSLKRFVGRSGLTKENVTQPGKSVLAVANGLPVIVNTASREVITVDADGEPQERIRLELRQDDAVRITGSARSDRMYIVASRGVLNICSLSEADCGRAVPLAGDLGAPVEAGDRLFVPDYSTGKVWIIDLVGARVVGQADVLGSRGKFDLLNRDGVVFFNESGGERAGVIRIDGSVQRVSKYDPKNPAKGLSGPAASKLPSGSARPGSATTSIPPRTGNTTPTSEPPPAETGVDLQIRVSKSTPRTDERITLSTQLGDTPRRVEWTFGDGTRAEGGTVDHAWADAQTYLVSVRVEMPDGRTGAGSTNVAVSDIPKARLTVTAGEGGSVASEDGNLKCPAKSTCTYDYNEGATVRLNATAAQDYQFSGWSNACTGTGPCTVEMSSARAVSAAYKATIANITVEVSGTGSVNFNGTNCTTTCKKTLPLDSEINLSATATGDNEFVSYTAPCGASSTCKTTATGTKTIRATFKAKQKQTLTVKIEGYAHELYKVTLKTPAKAETCPGANRTCTFSFVTDTEVELTGVASGGDYFHYWSGACQAAYQYKNPCYLKMTGPLTTTAVFGRVN